MILLVSYLIFDEKSEFRKIYKFWNTLKIVKMVRSKGIWFSISETLREPVTLPVITDDVENSLELELKELDKEIKAGKTEAKKVLNLEEKVKAQRQIKEMEKKRNNLRMNLYQAQDEIDGRKESLINEIEVRLRQKIETEELFTIRWCVV